MLMILWNNGREEKITNVWFNLKEWFTLKFRFFEMKKWKYYFYSTSDPLREKLKKYFLSHYTFIKSIV